MWLKRLLCFILSLLLLQSLVFSEEKSQQNTDLWNNIDLNLNFLESEQLFSQTRLAELEKKLEQSEKACQDKELVCQNLENSLAKSEEDTKKWKTCSIALGTTTVALTVTTVVLILALANNK